MVTLDTTAGPITRDTLIDGFTLTAANAPDAASVTHQAAIHGLSLAPDGALSTDSDLLGGGLVGDGSNHACSPTLRDVVFSGNHSVYMGGGMILIAAKDESSPLLAGVTFRANDATYGGGMAIVASAGASVTAQLSDVTFVDNAADDCGGGLFTAATDGGTGTPVLTGVTFSHNRVGGAVSGVAGTSIRTDVTPNGPVSMSLGGGLCNIAQSDGTSSPILTDVTFSHNDAGGSGGGLSNLAASGGTGNPVLTNVVFTNNQAGVARDEEGRTPLPMGVHLASDLAEYLGGGMFNLAEAGGTSRPALTGVIFAGNRARRAGGGLANETTQGIASPTLTNVVFSGNLAPGGAGLATHGDLGVTTLTNVTFSGNQADVTGGAIACGASSTKVSNLALTNSILWGNGASEIYTETVAITVTHSLVAGGWITGTDILDVDPQFVRDPGPGPDATWGTADDDAGDLRLQSASPAIDAGLNAAVPVSVTTDLAGRPRFLDVPGVPDTGVGAPPIVDLGAYEAGYVVYVPLVLRGE